MPRPTETHLESAAETQDQDAGASPASEPRNARTEGARPDRKTLPCAEGLIVPLSLTTYIEANLPKQRAVHDFVVSKQ